MKRLISVISFMLAITFATVSLFLPPKGQIDSSVLVFIAQLLIMTATFAGVDSYVNYIKSLASNK